MTESLLQQPTSPQRKFAGNVFMAQSTMVPGLGPTGEMLEEENIPAVCEAGRAPGE